MFDPRRFLGLEKTLGKLAPVALDHFNIATDFEWRDHAHHALARMRQVKMHIREIHQIRLAIFAIRNMIVSAEKPGIATCLLKQKPNAKRLHFAFRELKRHCLFLAIFGNLPQKTLKNGRFFQRRNIGNINSGRLNHKKNIKI